ncbi:MAG TPA: spore germination protein [Limnochordia bacterium]|nr:spore germination protein [Limnochordia bacterium]
MRLRQLSLRLRRIAFESPDLPQTLGAAAANPLALLNSSDAFAAIPFATELDQNVEALAALWRHQDGLISRRIEAGGRRFAIVFLKGTVDEARLEANCIRPLVNTQLALNEATLEEVGDRVLTADGWQRAHLLGDGIRMITRGFPLLFVDGEAHALAIKAPERPHRAITNPPNEAVVRGPHDGFNEALETNVALLRARLRTPLLHFEEFTLGRLSQTRVKIAYIDGLARPDLVAELKSRIERIEIDAVLESNYVQELIEETPYTIFPTVWYSERPDAVAGQLLEGRIAILTDGSPAALVMPTTFWALLQANEDYYDVFWYASFVRLMRIVASVIAVILPGLFVAVLTYTPEALPAPLLLQIAASSENAPLPTTSEVLLMLIAFDVLQEAGIRLPRPVGQTIGIVGGLFVGQMSVQAGLVTPTIVIVAALSTISTFLIPHYSLGNSARLLRYFVTAAASFAGLFGLLGAVLAISGHLAWLRSLGQPYLWPTGQADLSFVGDTLVRMPWWRMWPRPRSSRLWGSRREAFPLRPGDERDDS